MWSRNSADFCIQQLYALKIVNCCNLLLLWLICVLNIPCRSSVTYRLNFSTAFSTNAVSICQSAGLFSIERVEYSTRFLIYLDSELMNGDPSSVTEVI
jgi:hypothetical protein